MRHRSNSPAAAENSMMWLIIGCVVLFLFSGGDITGPPAPITVDHLCELVIYDGDPIKEKDYSLGQREVIQSNKAGSVRDIVTKAGGEFRLLTLDNLSNLTNDAPWVQAAALRYKGPPPWGFIVKGSKFWEGQLPKDVETSIATTKKVGGL